MSTSAESSEAVPRAPALTWSSPVLWVGIGVLLCFAAVFVFMLSELDAGEVRWNRMTFLYGTVEALVFAAAGALFGTQVQRERVVKAEERAEDAEKKAESNADAAASGRTLAKAAKVEAMTTAPELAQYGFSPQAGVTPTEEAAPVYRLATLAEELFPER